jgi:DMSO/TMAO reductase YedYZ heme-binding membrane subunit
VPTTVGRPRGRQGVHSGAAGDHTGKIVAVSTATVVVIVAVLALTKVGHVIDAATQHFMLYYAGVLALVGLTGSVLLGLVATDRIVMTPGHRVMAQAVHRAFSFGTLVFLIIHITTEILAQRSHALDAVVPFLSPYRTFYIGLGTIASDLILLLVITSVLRKRFTANGSAWRWRAIHYSSYAAFVFGVLHGLLGGRAAKPYVDWSYGFAIAVTAFGLAVRFLAVSLRPKESLGSSPSVDRAGAASSSPMRTAAMTMAQAQLGAQLGGATQVLPVGLGAGGLGADGAAGAATWTATALPGPGRSPFSGPLPALGPGPAQGAYGPIPAYAGSSPVPDAYGPVPDAYSDLGFTPLGAPPYGDDARYGMRARPYMPAEQPRPALSGPARQPRYEPGYDGPPRFEGAPRGHGDVPHDELSSYPYGPRGRRAKPVSPYPEEYRGRSVTDGRPAPRPGPMEPAPPRAAITAPPRPGDRSSGPQPQLGTGPMPRPGTGPMPRVDTGPMPRADTGPMPRADTGSMPRADTGSMPRADTGSMPRAGGGQPPRHGTGPVPRTGTGPMPRADTGSMPRLGTGPVSRVNTGPMPRVNTGPMPRVDTGPMPRPDTGPMPPAGGGQPPRHDTGPAPRTGRGRAPRADTGSMPRLPTGPVPRGDTGSMPRPDTGPMPRMDTGPMPRMDTGSMPRLGGSGPVPRPDTGPRPATGPVRATGSGPRHGRPVPEPATGPRTGSPPRPATRPSHRAKSTDPRYRDRPGPTGGNEWE